MPGADAACCRCQAVGSRANNFYLGNVAIMNLLLLIFFQWREVLESDPDATWEEMQHVQLGGVEQVVLQVRALRCELLTRMFGHV